MFDRIIALLSLLFGDAILERLTMLFLKRKEESPSTSYLKRLDPVIREIFIEVVCSESQQIRLFWSADNKKRSYCIVGGKDVFVTIDDWKRLYAALEQGEQDGYFSYFGGTRGDRRDINRVHIFEATSRAFEWRTEE